MSVNEIRIFNIEPKRCSVCGEPATHLIDLSTLSATLAPDPYPGRCEAHRPSKQPTLPLPENQLHE